MLLGANLILLVSPLIAAVMLLGLISLNVKIKVTIRICVVILVTFGFVYSVVSATLLLSEPKPTTFEVLRRGAEKVEVLAAVFDQGKAIYLWLRFPNEIKPRYYVFKWDIKLAEGLQSAMRQKKNSGTPGKVFMKYPFATGQKRAWGSEKNRTNFVPAVRRLPHKPNE